MKKIIITTAALFAFSASHAQSPTPNVKSSNKNLVSFSPGNIIGVIGGFYSYQQPGEYLVQYRRIIGNANAIRIGINANGSKYTNNKNDTLSGNSNYRNTKLGIGYERYSYISKAWNLYYGVDAQFENGISNNESNYNNYYYKTTSNNYNIGGMAYMGITVNLNNRLSIGLENGLKAGITNADGTNYQKQSSGGTASNYTYTTKGNYFNYVYPQLQVRIKF
jgi:hypothetical protein